MAYVPYQLIAAVSTSLMSMSHGNICWVALCQHDHKAPSDLRNIHYSQANLIITQNQIATIVEAV
jgi:hypothetical protein